MDFFTIKHKDKNSNARTGILRTDQGAIKTPLFMPVATQATVKSISSEELRSLGVDMVISNTYHLYLRPGIDLIKKAGGLHKFMSWAGAITTDSGGFQVFSLSDLRKIHDSGVEFKSHIDGSRHFFTPENVVDFQLALASDIIMPLDECIPYPAEKGYVTDSVNLTLKWAKKSLKRHKNTPGKSKLFGIVQGGTYHDERKRCALELVDMDMDGYAIGGVAVGEEGEIVKDVTEFTSRLLPESKVRYLMGVGTPQDILEAIASGVDMFDCVLPTRNGRNGQAFTRNGEIQIRNASAKEKFEPIEKGCSCFTCENYTMGYIRHLFNTGELLALRLISLHNINFYVKLVELSRKAIEKDSFTAFKMKFLDDYTGHTKERT